MPVNYLPRVTTGKRHPWGNCNRRHRGETQTRTLASYVAATSLMTPGLTRAQTHEPMLVIPEKLMMSPVTAERSEIGYIFRDNPEVFRGDDMLAVFIMYERAKRERSFFWPYLAILPEPDNIGDWNDQELDELQDKCVAWALGHCAEKGIAPREGGRTHAR
jgi:hypothetical protein